MSLENVIEKLLQEAIARGDFDNLEGEGKPLDLTAYFNTPEDLRMAYSVLKTNQIIPGEVEMIREIAEIKSQFNKTDDENEKKILSRKLNDKTLALDLAMVKYKRSADVIIILVPHYHFLDAASFT